MAYEDIAEAINKARAGYDADPTPENMLSIVGAMKKAAAALVIQRNKITNKEAVYALQPWDRQYGYFVRRLQDYQVTLLALTGHYGISEATKYHHVAAGDINRIYSELVIAPILQGNAASTIAPETHEWASVGIVPDAGMPVALANQLVEADQSFLARVKRWIINKYKESLTTILEASEEEAKPWLKEKVAELKEAAKEEMGEVIDDLQKEVEARAAKGAKKAVGPYLFLALGIGVLALAKK